MNNKSMLSVIVAISLFVTGCKSSFKLTSVKNVTVYNKFVKNGTSNSITSAFYNPTHRRVNATEFVDVTPSDSFKINGTYLMDVLKNARKIKKHYQQKVPGIFFAGEFYEGDRKHYFAYFTGKEVIIDFTDKKEYWLSQPLQYSKD